MAASSRSRISCIVRADLQIERDVARIGEAKAASEPLCVS
jgi:hypothetical protein